MTNNISQEPLILVTNDDGFNAPGINALVEVAREFGTVLKIAPDKPQSGMGHAITINSMLRLEKEPNSNGLDSFICSGTPVDCVKIALDVLLDRTPDLVVSGINHGSNASINVIYSGTMSAALEGLIEGIPSIGFSLLDYAIEADFTASKEYARKIIGLALGEKEGPFCLNVNIPKLSAPEIKGFKVCRQARAKWAEQFDARKDPGGKDYYWLTGKFVPMDDGDDTDVWALENGYVSVVPVKSDMTDFNLLKKIADWEP